MTGAGHAMTGAGHAMTDDADRLADAQYVVSHGRGAGTLRRLAYPLYVAVLLGATYGFTVARFVFVTSRPDWVRDHLLHPTAAAVALAALAGAATLVWRSSRRRGAAVPPLAWTDQVLTSAIDRALALTPWWRLTLVAAATGLGLAGALLGASLWASGVTRPAAFGVAAGVGVLAGALLAYAALWGQAGTRAPMRAASALRLLPIEDLRAHAATTDRLLGALLAGDPRAEQLELSAPPSRGRDLALRASGPVRTVVRRDVLGQRRDPVTFWRGAILALTGAGAAGWAVLQPAVPPLVAGLGILLLYAGVGAWSEGLRMSADQLGAPPLTGLSPARGAVAHSLLPAAAATTAWLGAAGGLLALGVPLSGPAGMPAGVATAAAAFLAAGLYAVAAALATTWLAAYRPPADLGIVLPGAGPWLMLLRLTGPGLAAFLLGVLLPGAIHGRQVTLPLALLAFCVGLGIHRMRAAAQRRPDS